MMLFLPRPGSSHGIASLSAETRDRTGDLQIFSLTLSQLSYRDSVLTSGFRVSGARLWFWVGGLGPTCFYYIFATCLKGSWYCQTHFERRGRPRRWAIGSLICVRIMCASRMVFAMLLHLHSLLWRRQEESK